MPRFVDPRTLARTKDLPLIARRVAEGFLSGITPGAVRGSGSEFSQYRSYEVGDAPARIDWKLFARSDRYFVREAARESDTQVWFLLDHSRSMLMRSHFLPDKKQSGKNQHQATNKGHEPWHKLDYARHLAASMAYLAQNQGDAVGYIGLSDRGLNFLPAATSLKHWYAFLNSLSQTREGQFLPKPETWEPLLLQMKKPALVLLISDFYQQGTELVDLVRRLNTSRNEVLAMQLMCADELQANYRGSLLVEDLESGEQLQVEAGQIIPSLHKRRAEHDKKLKDILSNQRAALHSVDIDRPLDSSLFYFLKQRQNLRLRV